MLKVAHHLLAIVWFACSEKMRSRSAWCPAAVPPPRAWKVRFPVKATRGCSCFCTAPKATFAKGFSSLGFINVYLISKFFA